MRIEYTPIHEIAITLLLLCSPVALSCAGVNGGGNQYFAGNVKSDEPDALDPRRQLLESKVEAVKLSETKMSDIVSSFKLARRLGCSIMLKDGISERPVSIDFPGGTLAEFMDALCAAADARVVYEKYAAVFEPKTGNSKPRE